MDLFTKIRTLSLESVKKIPFPGPCPRTKARMGTNQVLLIKIEIKTGRWFLNANHRKKGQDAILSLIPYFPYF